MFITSLTNKYQLIVFCPESVFNEITHDVNNAYLKSRSCNMMGCTDKKVKIYFYFV